MTSLQPTEWNVRMVDDKVHCDTEARRRRAALVGRQGFELTQNGAFLLAGGGFDLATVSERGSVKGRT